MKGITGQGVNVAIIDTTYAYYGDGGVSFAVPYTAGVMALGWQVNPELDKREMVELLFQTAYVRACSIIPKDSAISTKS